MSKKILGLDLGSNSIGWALIEQRSNHQTDIIAIGSRIFTKAVQEKSPTPTNQKRREARLSRRVIQRRARRKQRLLNYLMSLQLLPLELKDNHQPEIILNKLGDPYALRARALDNPLLPHELGRVLLHLVQRRGFLSNRKTRLGDLIDDPDAGDLLVEVENDKDKDNDKNSSSKEEKQFKQDIDKLRQSIGQSDARTLGEYLSFRGPHDIKRNRSFEGGYLRTDRQMYQDELRLIWDKQAPFHPRLTNEARQQIEEIIFTQRPLKLRANRVGKCSLEPKNKRAHRARLEVQRFRYLQDINHLTYFCPYTEKDMPLSEGDKEKLIDLFETNTQVTLTELKKTLGLSRTTTFNLERGNKKLTGNTTACAIRAVLPAWDNFSAEKQRDLVDDLISIQKRSTLKNRLINHWGLDLKAAVDVCMVELEPDHASLSLKAINKLLPFLEQGEIYSEARKLAGYGYEKEDRTAEAKLPSPPETANPIVNKGLHELKRVVNAVIAEYGKPDAIRVEMARDLEMNTTRYQENERQQKKNFKSNEKATAEYRKLATANPQLHLSHYPSRHDNIKYRLWQDQQEKCIYSGQGISLSTLFSAAIDVDHILPYSQSLDDSYMNKVVCYGSENTFKGRRTPKDAFSGNEEKWQQITGAIAKWDKRLSAKAKRFYQTAKDISESGFTAAQLNDTRYISRVALEYLDVLGVDISVTKGFLVSWLRHQWGLNNLLGDSNHKDRSDHRHHAIDALVIATIDRTFHKTLSARAKAQEEKSPEFKVKDLIIDPAWGTLRNDLKAALSGIVVAHDPQRKIRGALHEETGVGFKAQHAAAVYRVTLNGYFTKAQLTQKQLDKILDPAVKEIVRAHLEEFDNDPKKAFDPSQTVWHKDNKTPIKRVRIAQSKTTLKKLADTKFGVKNNQGEIFKWMAYGNTHHVEVLRDIKTQKITAKFVTVMQAAQRAKGIGQAKAPIIQRDHGADIKLLMALHINDLVNIRAGEKKGIYRVQKLGMGGNHMRLRLHKAANLNNKEEVIDFRFNHDNFEKYAPEKLHVNVLGKAYDKADHRD